MAAFQHAADPADGAERAADGELGHAAHQRQERFGQIRVGQHEGGGVQRRFHAEAAGEGDAGQLEDAERAAEGAAEPMFQPAEDGRGAGHGGVLQQFRPDALVRPAAELAAGRVRRAEMGGQVFPRAVMGDGPEDGIQPGADIEHRAAGTAMDEVGGEGLEFVIGQGAPGEGGGEVWGVVEGVHVGWSRPGEGRRGYRKVLLKSTLAFKVGLVSCLAPLMVGSRATNPPHHGNSALENKIVPRKAERPAPNEISYAGWARRADVLLRAKYPNLLTRIFEVASDRFVIYFDKSLQSADDIKIDEIRPVTLSLEITNIIPTNVLRELSTISDDKVSTDLEGFPFNRSSIFHIICGKFPALPLVNISDAEQNGRIYLEITEPVADELVDEVLEYCRNLRVPATIKIRVLDENKEPNKGLLSANEDTIAVRAWRVRPHVPEYVKHDEEFWFSNIGKIFSNEYSMTDFPCLNENESRCFIDATRGEHINIRQLLSFYDTIFISMPLHEEHDKFFRQQKISETDLLNLLEWGRVKIISTQPEERLRLPFLMQAAERTPTALMGRRTAAALIALDLVQTGNEYSLNKPENFREIGELSKRLSEKSGLPPRHLLNFLLWLLQARREAVWSLLDRGTMGIVPIGLGPLFGEAIEKTWKKDLHLEALVVSQDVHLAHALNATSFLRSGEPEGMRRLGNLMGDTLNFFRSFNGRIAPAWIGNIERKEAGKLILPPLPLFEFDTAIPLDEIISATNRQVVRNRGRALFSRVAEMTDEDRFKEINNLNKDLRRMGQNSGIISLDSIDTGISVLSTIYGFVYTPVPGLATLARKLLELIRNNPALEPDSKAYPLARRRTPSWMAASMTKLARVAARLS